MQTMISLLPYLWPVGNPGARIRVVVALVFMVLSKVATVYVPVIYGRIIDALAPKDAAAAAFVVPVALIVAYGAIRIGSAGFGEIRDALFASVQQRAVRLLALRTFRHLHAVSLRFHLDRQTGGLSRVIDRGVLGMQSVLRLAVFNVVPTALELVMVTAIIWRMFDWRYAVVTCLAVIVYVGFTAVLAGRRGRYRRTMNDTDNDASTKSLDSLINYETVKYFGNEEHEAQRYDHALARYERAAVRVQVSLNVLNLGSGGDHRHRPDPDHAAGGVRDARRHHDGRQVRRREHVSDPALPAAELPRRGLHDHQAGAGGHGADVRPAARRRRRSPTNPTPRR